VLIIIANLEKIMAKKLRLVLIAIFLTFSLTITKAQVVNPSSGMEHITTVDGRLAMTFNTNDEIFSPALKNATKTINAMSVGQEKNIFFGKTRVTINVLKTYHDDNNLPCKKSRMTSSEENVAYYIYVCHKNNDSDQVTVQSDLQSVPKRNNN